MDFRLFFRDSLFLIPIYCIITYIIYINTAKKAGKKASFWNIIGSLLLSIYIMGVAIVTGLTPLSGFHTDLRLDEINWNLIGGIEEMLDFHDAYGFINLFGNVVLFVPFGFFLPLLDAAKQRLWKVTLFGFLFSFAIEFWQLFLCRGTDVVDLVLNTLGAVIGCWMFFFFKFLFPKFANRFCSDDKRLNRFYKIETILGIVLPILVCILFGFIDRAIYFRM